jgi:hypothetical protein
MIVKKKSGRSPALKIKVVTKSCSKCKKQQVAANFGKKFKSRDGLAGQCRECVKCYQEERKNKTKKRELCPVADCCKVAIRRWCADHCRKEKCQHEGCATVPVFGVLGGGARYCAAHKSPIMITVGVDKCNVCTNGKTASYGWPEEKASKCSGHRLDGMIFKKDIKPFRAGIKAQSSSGTAGMLKELHDLYSQIDTAKSQQVFGLDTIQISNLSQQSGKALMWICARDHTWKAKVCNRVNGTGCPQCAGFHGRYLRDHQIYFEINWTATTALGYSKGDVDVLTQGSKKKLAWTCANGHTYNAMISNRTINKTACNVCVGHGVRGTCALLRDTPLYNEIHWQSCVQADITQEQIDSLTSGSNIGLFWQCKTQHIWFAQVNNRRRSGCPVCAGAQGLLRDSALYQELDLDACLNRGITEARIETITLGAKDKLIWKCNKSCECEEHIWYVSIPNRVRYGCTFCMRKRICPCSSLQSLFPEIAAELHPDDSNDPWQIAPHSGNIYYWKCAKDAGHTWYAAVTSRTSNQSGCPVCRTRSKGEEACELALEQLGLSYIREHPCARPYHRMKYDFIVCGEWLLEYDGEQHFVPRNFGSKCKSALEMFQGVQRRDKLKNNLAAQAGVRLLRIPFTMKSVPEIMSTIQYFMNSTKLYYMAGKE